MITVAHVMQDGEAAESVAGSCAFAGKRYGDSHKNLGKREICVPNDGAKHQQTNNMVFLYSDAEKRQTALAAAEVIAGWSGLPWLVAVTQAALIASWAYAEAILDTRTLLEGKRVPLMHSGSTWTLSLEGVSHFLKGGKAEKQDTPGGIYYKDYLRVLLFCSDLSTSAYRTMDMIQNHFLPENPYFRMANAVQAVSVRTVELTSPLFSALPAVTEFLKKRSSIYMFTETCSADYGG